MCRYGVDSECRHCTQEQKVEWYDGATAAYAASSSNEEDNDCEHKSNDISCIACSIRPTPTA